MRKHVSGKLRLSALTVFFITVSAGLILFAAVQTKLTVFTIGDSTMSVYELPDLCVGWAQVLSGFFTDDVTVIDAARSGRSTKSFIDEGLWDSVVTKIKPGDYVVIQFGHNDEKSDTARHTDPWTTYTDNLKKFVTETRARGGIPVLCTSIARRFFEPDGTLKDSHGDYPAAVRKLAADMNVPFVDMELKTKALIESYGADSSKTLFNYVEPGISPKYPNGNKDNTHLNSVGAYKVAALFIEGIKELQLGLAAYIK